MRGNCVTLTSYPLLLAAMLWCQNIHLDMYSGLAYGEVAKLHIVPS
jgi:hypothetical protein